MFHDESTAKHFLKHVGYARLKGYLLPLRNQNGLYPRDTYFEEAVTRYEFDRHLRLLLLDGIERIEISMRRAMVETFCLHPRYGDSHSYINNSSIFESQRKYEESVTRMVSDMERVHGFLTQYRNRKNVNDPEYPPLWEAVETFSFGTLSFTYNSLSTRVKKALASHHYGKGLHHDFLKTFLHNLSIVRNLCAHHSRVWDETFRTHIGPKSAPYDIKSLLKENHRNKKIYGTFIGMGWFLDQIHPGHDLTSKLKVLISQFDLDPQPMGFPSNFFK